MVPLITFIIPVYNVEKYLPKCIDSVLAQSYGNIEVILVDDGSNDGSEGICDSYANIDKRVQVIHIENGGVSSARNMGLRFAQGSYIAFIDSDDYVSPFMAEKLYSAMQNNNSDLAMCFFSYTDEDGNITDNFVDNTRIGEYETDELLRMLASGWTFGILVWNKLFKKSIFDEGIRFVEGKTAEDELISHHLLSKVKKAVIIPDILCFYRQRKGSITNSTFSKKNLDSIDALIDRVEFFVSEGKKELAYISLVSAMRNLASLWRFRNQNDEIRLLLKEHRKTLLKLCKTIGKQKTDFKFVVSVFLFRRLFPAYLLLRRIKDL